MILPGTYANGFAPRDGRPLYPSLWTGCVGAWNPGLGVSGSTLRDWSGFQNNGTLTNGPTWAASQGKYAINFASGAARTILCSSNVFQLGGLLTVAGFFTVDAQNQNNPVIAKGTLNGDSSSTFALYWNAILGFSFFVVNAANTLGIVRELSRTNVAGLYHVAGIADGVNLRIFINGVQANSVASAVLPRAGTSHTLNIGADSNFVSTRVNLGGSHETAVYNRALSPQEIQLLASRRGIAYELAPHRRSSAQVTTNRRRRIIIGGNR